MHWGPEQQLQCPWKCLSKGWLLWSKTFFVNKVSVNCKSFTISCAVCAAIENLIYGISIIPFENSEDIKSHAAFMFGALTVQMPTIIIFSFFKSSIIFSNCFFLKKKKKKKFAFEPKLLMMPFFYWMIISRLYKVLMNKVLCGPLKFKRPWANSEIKHFNKILQKGTGMMDPLTVFWFHFSFLVDAGNLTMINFVE